MSESRAAVTRNGRRAGDGSRRDAGGGGPRREPETASAPSVIAHVAQGPLYRKADLAKAPLYRKVDLSKDPLYRLGELLSPHGRQTLTQGALHSVELTQYLEEYARCGGLPAPLTDMLRDRRVADETTLALWRGLAADIRRLDRNEARLEKLLSRMVVGLASLTNEADVARDMDVAKPTGTEYLNLLAESFALLVLHQPDPKKQGGPSLTKPRKLYFGDPGFAAIPAALSPSRSAPEIPDLVENVLAIALFRQAERDGLQRFREPQRLFLWRSSDGREIDFITPVGDSTLPVESKFGRRMDGKDYESMQKAFGRGVMVSRETLITNRNILTIPAGVLLAHLG